MEEIIEEIKNTKLVTPIGDFNCQSFPLIKYKTFEITEEELTKLGKHELKWNVEEYDSEEEVDDEEKPILDEHEIIIGYEKKLVPCKKYNISLIPNDNSEELHEQELNELRVKRKTIFKAFDIYKSNVEYSAITESEETHAKILAWYQKALDLDYNAINEYPSELEKYL